MSKLITVHNEVICKTYKAPYISVANLWKILSNALIFIISIILTFTTQGLWKKTNNYLEHPVINLTEKFFFVLGGFNKTLFWSSFEEFNEYNMLTIPIIQTNQIDKNNDGKIDIVV